MSDRRRDTPHNLAAFAINRCLGSIMTWKRWRTNCLPWRWSTRTWVIAIVLAVLMSPFVTRWCCLWQVPDVALPFDVDEFIGTEVPEKEDAFVRYAAAVRMLGRNGSKWSTRADDSRALAEVIGEAVVQPDNKWDDRLTQWLLDNSEVLAEYQRAAAMERAGGPSLRTADVTTILTVHNDLRHLARLAALEAIRCERAGDLEEAWEWHRANLQCARHAEKPGWAICRLVGMSVRSLAARDIAKWSSHSLLTSERLHEARLEVKAEAARRTPLSDVSKAEYLMVRNTFQRADAPNHLFPQWNSASPYEPQLLVGKRWALWSVGQPEVLLRLLRQVLVNNAGQLDQSLHVRRKTVRSEPAIVFELDPAMRRQWGQFDSAALARALGTPFGKTAIHPFTVNGNVDLAIRTENARLAALDVVLAAQEYRRVYGEFPATLESLVPTFLDAVPFDPMDASGASLRYRRDENGEAVVWSIGRDEQDDGGDVELVDRIDKDAGYRIRVRPIQVPETNKKMTTPATLGTAPAQPQ